jgi:iron(III) transport system permease protein
LKFVAKMKSYWNAWTIWSFVCLLFLLLPQLAIIQSFFSARSANWEHVRDYLLLDMLQNTTYLIVFTGFFTMLLGISLAWLVSAYEFPWRRYLRWGLVLPLTIPPYIGAYTYHGMLNYTGFVQTFLRNSWDIHVNPKMFDMMTLPGASYIFTMFLFPYVYVGCRAFLSYQSAALVENARLLGSSSWEIFFRIVLPLSRVAIVGGVSLVVLEVINDYGVVKYYGIQTFTTGIFQTWFAMNDLHIAVQLAGTLMMIVIFLMLLERLLRGRKRFHFASSQMSELRRIQLSGWKAWVVTTYCSLIFAFAFLIPFLQLLFWAWDTYQSVISADFVRLVMNSIGVSAFSSCLIIGVAIIIGNSNRLQDTIFSRISSKLTLFGYSLPGAVIAIGVITLFIAIDRSLSPFYAWFGISSQLVISSSLVLLLFAYVVRFLAVGYQTIASGFEKIGNTYTDASRTLGMSLTETFVKVDLRLMKTAIVGGFILVFIDILKELPLTLLLQPFNFSTLALKAYQYASDERIQEAAVPSVMIILISVGCVYVLQRLIDKETS